MPIKCAGAPQKVLYLSGDAWYEDLIVRDIVTVILVPIFALEGKEIFTNTVGKFPDGKPVPVEFPFG